MLSFHMKVRRRALATVLSMAFVCTVATASAHLHWQQVNGVTPDTVALYHFDNATSVAAQPAAGLPVGLVLTSILAGLC